MKYNTEKQSKRKQLFVPWQEGYFDIHHINTGRGDAIFLAFPYGTTLMFDAGEIVVNRLNGVSSFLRRPLCQFSYFSSLNSDSKFINRQE